MRKLVLSAVVTLFGLAAPLGAAAFSSSAAPVLYHVPILGTMGLHASLAHGSEVQSTNWSGYADIGANTYETVSSSWTEPAVSCPGTGLLGLFHSASYSAFWVGLDGYNSNSVEQIGTDSDCTSNGSGSYYAWYEMYPAGSMDISTSSYPVKAGDVMTGSVTSNSSNKYTLTLSDATESPKWSFSISITQSGLARSSAEWVAEAPSECSSTCSVLPLSDFHTVTFSGASVQATTGAPGTISSFPDSEMQMASSTTLKANPSALNAAGTGFSVTWAHS
jgi:hypothetical protein